MMTSLAKLIADSRWCCVVTLVHNIGCGKSSHKIRILKKRFMYSRVISHTCFWLHGRCRGCKLGWSVGIFYSMMATDW